LRPPPAKTQDKKYKTRMCRYGAGTCPYGVSCSYAHSAVVFRAEKSTLRAVDAKSGSVRAQEELRPREPDEPPGEPTDVVSRLERLRALRDSGSVSAVEFEVLKQQVLREPGSFAAQAPVLLAPTAPPPPRCLSPPPPDAYMLPAMAMPPRVVPRPPAYAPQPPYAAVPGPPRGDLGLNHGRRVLDRISVDEAHPEPLAGDLVGADPGEPMDVRGRLAGAPERESANLAAAPDGVLHRTELALPPAC
jgi:hypothetical protein